MNRCEIGDCREIMRRWIDEGVKVQMCVTSPPYWGLRDYGVAGQLGLESTPQEYVANMVEVFRLVRELLADDGTLWLNLGDSYAGSGKGGGGSYGPERKQWEASNANIGILPIYSGKSLLSSGERAESVVASAIKPKDLVGIPWSVAFALRADGWYLRQDIIWSKPNPMPESIRDRCTKSHEYLFLLSKNERYYFDADAIAEPLITGDTRRPYGSPGANALDPRGRQGNWEQRGYSKPYDGKSTKNYASGGAQDASATKARIVDGILAGDITTRNKRSVWTITTKPFAGAHFATFPPDLIEPCMLAGSRSGDIVLDPFMGSGTTGQVAQALGRRWLGCELNAEYATLQAERTRQTAMVL